MSRIDISKTRLCDACDKTTINNKIRCNTYELAFKNLHKPVKLCEDCFVELFVALKLKLVEDNLLDRANDLYSEKVDEIMG